MVWKKRTEEVQETTTFNEKTATRKFSFRKIITIEFKKNVSYVYLGGFIDEKEFINTPLAFDIPSNHKAYINVLLLNCGRKQISLTTCTI